MLCILGHRLNPTTFYTVLYIMTKQDIVQSEEKRKRKKE